MTAKIQKTCCVCGYKLPELTIEELTKKGAVTMRGDGRRLFHCPKHTYQEITDAVKKLSGFRRASEL